MKSNHIGIRFRIPMWLWFLVIASFLISLQSVIFSPSSIDIMLFTSDCGFLIIIIIYRKFDFNNTSVGCEHFRVISIRKSFLREIEVFIKILHSTPSNLRNTPETFVQSNYYERLFKHLLAIFSLFYSPLPTYFDLFNILFLI